MIWVIRFWILFSAWLVAGGWLLSALHALNRAGYIVVLASALMTGLLYLRRHRLLPPVSPGTIFRRCCRRFQRPAPFLFLVLAISTLLVGLLYEPFSADSDSYRLPRILHWLGQGQWHWIRTFDIRMNMAGVNYEWLAAPLILFTGSDRYLFLINWVSYLMLPGLIFSVFQLLGVRPRVAWWWMWLLASGWCFVFQASSNVNDSFATIYALAAVALARRAYRDQTHGDALLALLAAAFLSGVKQTDLPLAPLGVVVLLPIWRLFLVRPMLSGLALATSFFLSAAPIIAANLYHTGTWTGIPKDSLWNEAQLDSPFWGIIGNIFCLSAQNLMPPIFPWTEQWHGLMTRFVHTPFGTHFLAFESFGELSHGGHSINESNAGIGAAICLFVLISSLAMWWPWRREPQRSVPPPGRWLRLLPWLLLLIFMAKVGTFQNGRQLSPYYVFLFPAWLCLPAHSQLIHRRWWRQTGLAIMVLTIGLLVISRDRPLFPAQTLFHQLEVAFPHSKLFPKMAQAFSVRRQTLATKHLFKDKFSASESTIGYAAFMEYNEPELWFPFGRRKVVRILPEDRLQDFRAQGIHYIVLEDFYLKYIHQDLNDWLKQYHAMIVQNYIQIPDNPQSPHIYLVKIDDPSS